jgi:tetratricopeptide (TPR) repeat protein
MTAAYCLLTYTSFFSAMDQELPSLVQQVALTDEERALISARAVGRSPDPALAEAEDSGTLIEAPHPAVDPAAERAARVRLYQGLAQSYLKFVEGLAVWESARDDGRIAIRKAIAAIPGSAAELFDAQYLSLLIEYPAFRQWALLYELTKSRQLTADQLAALETKIRLVAQATEGIDVGLRHLQQLVAAVDQRAVGGEVVRRVMDGLRTAYLNSIEEPIITDRSAPTGAATLVYPRKCDIFVPQSFQVIRYLDPQLRLELDNAWADATASEDIGAFIVRYLESAYSTEAPLLVLGHPGSGKSLLTEMIAARFAPPLYHPVMIELRDIEPDSELQDLIELQIRRDTGRDVNWATFADELHDSPPVIILDGYDELLQASGKVFSNYLANVQKFQRREAVQGRPARVIVSSRITLLDKAVIPLGVTVLRLHNFDASRRDQWIGIWNKANSSYFAETGVEQFALRPGSSASHLAAQPLLLMMLAVYDSHSNQLRDADLDRTLLYHRLLVQYVEREHTKGEAGSEFLALTSAERNEQVETDLERLGIAAVGMFNRHSLDIQRDDLSNDIAYFGLAQQRDVPHGRALTEAEQLVGSFFFKPERKNRGNAVSGASAPVAFEFLHNTFGEFLTADFLLRKILSETLVIRKLGEDRGLLSTREQRLEQPPADWFACLAYTSLHTRPVVGAMLREWLPHRLRAEGRHAGDFETDLAEVVMRQVARVLRGDAASTLADKLSATPFEDLPVLGHLAVYCLNLVLLKLILTRSEVVVDEAPLADPLAGCPPWDRLTHLWRSWFSLESLAGLRSAMHARRQDDVIYLSHPSQALPKGRSGLEDACNVADALADEIVYGLALPHVFDLSGRNRDDLAQAAQRLSQQGIDVAALLAARATGGGVPWTQDLGAHMISAGRLEEAEKLFRRVLKALERSGDRTDLADTYVKLARLMSRSGRLAEAEDSYEKALDILGGLGDLRRMADVCREIAQLNSAAAILDEAEGWSQRALEILDRLGDKPSSVDAYCQLAGFMRDWERFDAARMYLQGAQEIAMNSGNQYSIGQVYGQLGHLAVLTGSFNEAEAHYQRALMILEGLNDQLGIARTYRQIAELRWQVKQPQEAEALYRRALGIFERLGAQAEITDVRHSLVRINQQKQ